MGFRRGEEGMGVPGQNGKGSTLIWTPLSKSL